MTAADRLDEIQARADGATDGPWGVDGAAHPGPDDSLVVYPLEDGGAVAYVQPLYADAVFIAHARADVPRLVAALRAVLDLHKPRTEQVLATECSAETCDCEDGCQTVPIKVCEHCMDLGDSAHHYAYEEGGIETVLWPCPTVRALEDALGEVAS